MNENILPTIFWGDKTKPLCIVEPFYGSFLFGHTVLLIVMGSVGGNCDTGTITGIFDFLTTTLTGRGPYVLSPKIANEIFHENETTEK